MGTFSGSALATLHLRQGVQGGQQHIHGALLLQQAGTRLVAGHGVQQMRGREECTGSDLPRTVRFQTHPPVRNCGFAALVSRAKGSRELAQNLARTTACCDGLCTE